MVRLLVHLLVHLVVHLAFFKSGLKQMSDSEDEYETFVTLLERVGKRRGTRRKAHMHELKSFFKRSQANKDEKHRTTVKQLIEERAALRREIRLLRKQIEKLTAAEAT